MLERGWWRAALLLHVGLVPAPARLQGLVFSGPLYADIYLMYKGVSEVTYYHTRDGKSNNDVSILTSYTMPGVDASFTACLPPIRTTPCMDITKCCLSYPLANRFYAGCPGMTECTGDDGTCACLNGKIRCGDGCIDPGTCCNLDPTVGAQCNAAAGETCPHNGAKCTSE